MRTEPLALCAALAVATPAVACSPAPSCWIEGGPEYLLDVCAGYTKDHRTIQEIASYLDDPKEIGTFVKACAKLHIHFPAAKNPKDFKSCMPYYDPDHPYANRVPSWAAKTDPSVTPYDGSWQHAFCDSKHHVVIWCPPAPDDEVSSECKSIEEQLSAKVHKRD